MKKQTLNEELLRMKKLSGLLSENEFNDGEDYERMSREVEYGINPYEDQEEISQDDSSSTSPEALIAPLEKEMVKNSDGSLIEGVELIEFTWQDEERLFGKRNGEDDGIMAKEFPETFSREAMEKYKGEAIEDYFLPIEREQRWFKLIEPIALHYTYGFEGHYYSKFEAAQMALENGKKYVVAQYMS